jgi:hypothetical protein
MEKQLLLEPTPAGFPGLAFSGPQPTLIQPRIDRSHVVVDLENLCGGSDAVARQSAVVRRSLSYLVDTARTQVVVAVGINAWVNAPLLGFEWSGARLLVGRGIDGADKRLIEDLVDEPQAARSARVVIASGDGRFAAAAEHLKARGAHLVVVSRPDSLSRRLRKAANEVHFLPIAPV